MKYKRVLYFTIVCLIISACGSRATNERAVSATTFAPTARSTEQPQTPTATALSTLPPGTTIAGVDVSGQTIAAARKLVGAALARLDRSLQLAIDGQPYTLDTQTFVQPPALDALFAQLGATTNVPLTVAIDQQQIRAALQAIAADVDQPPITAVISDSDALTRTFTFVQRAGRTLDLDQAVARISAIVTDTAMTSLTLDLSSAAPPPPSIDQLDAILEKHAGYWRGTAGIFVQDLATGATAGYNENTVFSGASVMKVPIMIYVYAKLGTLNEQQRGWMERMIGDSKNWEATKLLAAAVGGSTTDDAFVAVTEMTAMLRDLGLQRTYMLVPYEGSNYLRRVGKLPPPGPAQEGAPPYTEADPYLRTTPAEMSRLFVMLDQCSRDQGPLHEKYGNRLSAALCQEMIAWLQMPHDETRMKAGVPPGTVVAHKGGWTADMQADVGIVESPGGRYVAAIYVYRPVSDGYVTGPTAKASPYLPDFSHTIYSFFNPEPVP